MNREIKVIATTATKVLVKVILWKDQDEIFSTFRVWVDKDIFSFYGLN
ncbi:MAG: hypothetical protein OEV44_09670 [Spirochaetota bacterium]|nr:hypothetical protein [Spirochaetota bacterium]